MASICSTSTLTDGRRSGEEQGLTEKFDQCKIKLSEIRRKFRGLTVGAQKPLPWLKKLLTALFQFSLAEELHQMRFKAMLSSD